MSVFFFSSRGRHTRYWRDWSSDVCSSDLQADGNFIDTGARHFGADVVVPITGTTAFVAALAPEDRKSVVEGKSVGRGGRRIDKGKRRNGERAVAGLVRMSSNHAQRTGREY